MKLKNLCVLLFFLITTVVQFYAPWWVFIILFISFGIISHIKWKLSYLTIFLLGSLNWFLPALLFYIFNQGILATRIAILLGINEPLVLPFLTGVIGGLLALSGFILGQTFVEIIWLFSLKKKGNHYES